MRGCNSVKPTKPIDQDEENEKQKNYSATIKYYGTGYTAATAGKAYEAFRRPAYAGTIAEVKSDLE